MCEASFGGLYTQDELLAGPSRDSDVGRTLYVWVLLECQVCHRIRNHEDFIVQDRVVAEGMITRHFSRGTSPRAAP